MGIIKTFVGEDDYRAYRNELVENINLLVKGINTDRFSARMRQHLIDKYSDKRAFDSLSEADIFDLKEEISPLIISADGDEMAKRFDYLLYTIEFAFLDKKPFSRPKSSVVATAEKLERKGSIGQVEKNKELIYRIQEEEFWEEADLFDYEIVRKALRELIKLIDREEQGIYYTDFKDKVIGFKEGSPIYEVNDLESYKKRVTSYFKKYKDDLPIYKLRNNKELTEEDIKYFERVLFEELGDQEDYKKAYGDKPLLKLLSSIIGMDKEAAQKEFSKFLTDEKLNSDQINFVNNIIDYIVKNGSFDKSELQNNQMFNKNGGIIDLFENDLSVAKNIISTIDSINRRLG